MGNGLMGNSRNIKMAIRQTRIRGCQKLIDGQTWTGVKGEGVEVGG